jgi:hypothetical protein
VLLRLAYLTVMNTFAVLRLFPMSDRDKDTKILALRHQIGVLERQLGDGKVRFTPADRAFFAAGCSACREGRYVGCGCWSARRRSCVGIVTWSRAVRRQVDTEAAGPAADGAFHPCPRAASGAGEPPVGVSARLR